MWSKILICSLAVLFLLSIAGPILANDGRARDAVENEPGDEHPWGGDRNDDDNPVVIGGNSSLNPDVRQPNMFFIFGAERTWLFIKDITRAILSHPQVDGGTTTGNLDTISDEAGNN